MSFDEMTNVGAGVLDRIFGGWGRSSAKRREPDADTPAGILRDRARHNRDMAQYCRSMAADLERRIPEELAQAERYEKEAEKLEDAIRAIEAVALGAPPAPPDPK